LNLALHKLDADAAVWLIGIKAAVQVEPTPTPAVAAE
jgi:hypothetical protein